MTPEQLFYAESLLALHTRHLSSKESLLTPEHSMLMCFFVISISRTIKQKLHNNPHGFDLQTHTIAMAIIYILSQLK